MFHYVKTSNAQAINPSLKIVKVFFITILLSFLFIIFVLYFFPKTPVSAAARYKFPWKEGETWTWWTRGSLPVWHGKHDENCEAGRTNPEPSRCAIDFGVGGTGEILAMASGTVSIIRECTLTTNIRITDPQGIPVDYYHIDSSSIDDKIIKNGATINQGTILGRVKKGDFDEACGEAKQDHTIGHVHLIIPTSAFTIDGWTFNYPSTTATKGNSQKNAGSTFSSSNKISSLYLSILTPKRDRERVDDKYTIVWRDSNDGNSTASISYYYNTEDSGTSGTLIAGCSNQLVRKKKDNCSFSADALPEGEVFIYGCITDGSKTECRYANGSIYHLVDNNRDMGRVFVDTEWTQVNFNEEFEQVPTVITTINSEVDYDSENDEYADKVYARIHDVTTTGFKVKLEEDTAPDGQDPTWDGIHGYEEVSWYAASGSNADEEVGQVTIGTGWTTINYSRTFDEIPLIFTSVQTENGDDIVYVDVKDIGVNGFKARLEEPAGEDGPHAAETIGWIAMGLNIYGEMGRTMTSELTNCTGCLINTGIDIDFTPDESRTVKPLLLAEVSTEYGPAQVNVDILEHDINGFRAILEEDKFYQEYTHVDEKISWATLTPRGIGRLKGAYNVFGNSDGTWYQVNFNQNFKEAPAVIVTPNSNYPVYSDVFQFRVKDITTTGFKVQLTEDQLAGWDGLVGVEDFSWYAVSEPAENEAAGSIYANTDWQTVSFDAPFSSTPKLFTTINSELDSEPVQVQVKNVTSSSFDVRIVEDAGRDGDHSNELVGWVAVEEANDGELGSIAVSNSWTTVTFSEEFPIVPNLTSSVVTTDENDDPVYLEIKDITTEGFDVRILEQQTSDGNHTSETVDWYAWASFQNWGVESVNVEEKQVTFDNAFVNDTPVVVAEVNGECSSIPAYTNIRDISKNGFKISISEDFKSPQGDNDHCNEVAGWLAVDSQTNTPSLVAQKTTVGDKWTKVYFNPTQNFQNAPKVLASVNSQRGGDLVYVDIRNVTTEGFEMRLEEPLGYGANAEHVNEVVGWIAFEDLEGFESNTIKTMEDMAWSDVTFETPFAEAPSIVAMIQTENGKQKANVDIANVTKDGFKIRVEEDTSLSDGLHPREYVTWLAMPVENAKTTSGETYSTHEWQWVQFETPFESTPHLAVEINSEYGNNTAEVDIHKLSRSGFRVRVEEDKGLGWDGLHDNAERIVWYATTEPPTADFQHGRVGVNTTWSTIPFNPVFAAGQTPVVISDIFTEREGQTVAVNMKNSSNTGIDIQIFEDAKSSWDKVHGTEEVSWFAILTPPEGEIGILPGVDHNWLQVSFSAAYSQPPKVFAQLQTQNGAAIAQADIKDVTTSGFKIRVEEEKKYDGQHDLPEIVGWWAIP